MRRPRRVYEAFNDQRDEQDGGAGHRKANAEGCKPEHPGRCVEEDGREPAEKSSSNDKKAEAEDGISCQAEAAQSFFGGHGRHSTMG